MEVEWSVENARANLAKHGVAFEEARHLAHVSR